MAYAWQITDSLKQKGLSNEKCRKLLQSEDDKKLRLSHDALTQYHKFFTIQDFELKLLYKYMYLYLED